MFEPELHLGGDILVPDLAGWRIGRMPKVDRGAYFTLAPDWICEVLSPSTRKIDQQLKLPIYARERVVHMWFVDPAAQSLEVFRRESNGLMLVGHWSGNDKVRAEPFDAIELELEALWAGIDWDSPVEG